MGWTGLHRERGMTDRAFFEHEFPNTLTTHGEILACASVHNVFYAAVRNKKDERVWALVVLMRRGRGYYNFHYKEMDEGMGPAEDRCPERILDLLSPLPDDDSSYAGDWRRRCREYHATRIARPKIKIGDRVRFDRPLNFTNGDSLSEFTFEGRTTFRSNGNRYRIPNWRDRQHQVIPA